MAVALHAYARRGALEQIRYSVEELSEDVNALDIQHMTAMHYAAKRGFAHIVHYLHDKRADLEIKNGVGQTALTLASQANQLEAVEALLKRGANAQAQEEHGITALHRACLTGNELLVRTLIKGKADPLAIEGFAFESALHYAAREGHDEILRAILEHVKQPHDIPDHQAIEEERDMLKREQGESAYRCGFRARRLDERNSRGETALHLSAANAHLQCVKVLLQMGTESWKRWFLEVKEGKNEETALFLACKHEHNDVARFLLDEKADPNTSNAQGRSPMHVASQARNLPLLNYLLRAGGNFMQETLDGSVPLTHLHPDRSLLLNALRPLGPTPSQEEEKRSSEDVLMLVSDVGGGRAADAQDYMTRRRIMIAETFKAHAKLSHVDPQRFLAEQEEARLRRLRSRMEHKAMSELETRLRAETAQKKIARYWKDYQRRKDEMRKELQKKKRREEAERARKEKYSTSQVKT